MSGKGHAASNARGATSVTRRNGNKKGSKYAPVYPGTAGFVLPGAALDADGIVDTVTDPSAATAEGAFDGIAAAGTPAGSRKQVSGMFRSGVVPGVNTSSTTFKPYARLRYKAGRNAAPRSTIDYHGIPLGADVYVPYEVTADTAADELAKDARVRQFAERAATYIVRQTAGIAAQRADIRDSIAAFMRDTGAEGKTARKLIIEAVQRASRADVICLDQWPSGHWCDVLVARR
jgi:hypothetical protein